MLLMTNGMMMIIIIFMIIILMMMSKWRWTHFWAVPFQNLPSFSMWSSDMELLYMVLPTNIAKNVCFTFFWPTNMGLH